MPAVRIVRIYSISIWQLCELSGYTQSLNGSCANCQDILNLYMPAVRIVRIYSISKWQLCELSGYTQSLYGSCANCQDLLNLYMAAVRIVRIYSISIYMLARGGSRNSLRGGGGGVLGQNSSKGGGVRVQVRGNFHILTSKKPQNNL